MNSAKQSKRQKIEEIFVVEGYMDVVNFISLAFIMLLQI